MYKISVVIPTFNSRNFILNCLSSIKSAANDGLELIVVDNGSVDKTPELIRSSFPDVKLIENRTNLGAAKARNQGIALSSGEWVLTLDCDVSLKKDFFSELAKSIEKIGPDIGMIQPKIFNEDNKTIYSTGIYLSAFKRFFDIGMGKKDSRRFNYSRFVFGGCSAAALYRRRMMDQLREENGFFDERFFFLVEDVDLAWRAQEKGWKALFFPQAVCLHKGNSSECNSKMRQFLCWRNRNYMLKKHKVNWLLLALIKLMYDFPRSLLMFATNPLMRAQPKFYSENT